MTSLIEIGTKGFLLQLVDDLFVLRLLLGLIFLNVGTIGMTHGLTRSIHILLPSKVVTNGLVGDFLVGTLVVERNRVSFGALGLGTALVLSLVLLASRVLQSLDLSLGLALGRDIRRTIVDFHCLLGNGGERRGLL